MTDEERVKKIAESINSYRVKKGIMFKKFLKQDFFDGKVKDPYLQQFRNMFTFDTLDKIKFHTTQREMIVILSKRDKHDR